MKTIFHDSRLSQGTVLVTLKFMLFISDIDDDIDTITKLFADDCLLLRRIPSTKDTTKLQMDLNTIHQWVITGK